MLVVGTTIRGLSDFYRCDAKHAEGGFGIAYRGTRASDGAPVILKELRIERLKDWKAVELFEREAAVLKNLDHPRIPAYYDFFAWDGEAARAPSELASRSGTEHPTTALVLVQRRIEGESVAQRIEAGAHFSTPQAERLLRGMLEILRYLHELQPPVIHRDINPANVVLDEKGAPHLIDFGGVQDRLRLATAGSTQIGTIGFMPIEQLGGAPRPNTDLYGLGMTMLSALSRMAPTDMPLDEETSKVKVAEVLPTFNVRLRDVIDSMVEPLASKRPKSAAEVLARLDGRAAGGVRLRYAAVAAGVCALGVGGWLFAHAKPPPRVDAQPAPTTPPPENAAIAVVVKRTIKAEWKAHVRNAIGASLVKGAPCRVQAEIESEERRSDRTQRIGHLTVLCAPSPGSHDEKVVYEQKEEWLKASSVWEAPGDTPGTYSLTVEIRTDDGPTHIHTNVLQKQMELTRGGSTPWGLELFVENRSTQQTTALFPESETKEVPFRPTLVRAGRVVGMTGAPPVPVGAACTLTAASDWVTESNGESLNCEVSLFCNDKYIYSKASPCPVERPLKLDRVSFEGVGSQAEELHVDVAKSSVTFSERAVPYSLDIRLDR
jgi:serine/threonine protein kinase